MDDACANELQALVPDRRGLGNNKAAIINGCCLDGGSCQTNCPLTPDFSHEVYNGMPGTWSSFSCTGSTCQYVRAHLLPSGKVLGIATLSLTSQVSQFLTPESATVEGSTGTPPTPRGSPNSLLLIDLTNRQRRVILIAGHGVGSPPPAFQSWDYADNPAPSPAITNWQTMNPLLTCVRAWCDTVILPNGWILVVGGRPNGATGDNFPTQANTVDQRKPEWRNAFDVVSAWQALAQAVTPRDYHSGALLLADGRVASFGGEYSSIQPNSNKSDVEVFSPPYLFSGSSLAPRPTILPGTPSVLSYNTAFTLDVSLPPGKSLGAVCLIRAGSTTHALNFEQRYLKLRFFFVTALDEQSGATVSTINVDAPPDPNWAPEGYYMLFAVTTDGIPSVAKFVQLA